MAGYIFSEKDKPMKRMLQLGFDDVSYPNLIDYAKWKNYCRFGVSRFMYGDDIDKYVFHINELVVKRDVTYEWCELFYNYVKDVIPPNNKELNLDKISFKYPISDVLFAMKTTDGEVYLVDYYEDESDTISEIILLNANADLLWFLKLCQIFVNYG